MNPTAPSAPARLGSQFGTIGRKATLARETSARHWQVKMHDPTNRLAGHDGWLLLGTDWPTLDDACAATGMSYAH